MENYSDYPEWDRAVVDTYNLEPYKISREGCSIRLFTCNPLFGKRILSSGPYASDGGVIVEDECVVNDVVEDLEELRANLKARYILLKTRQPYFVRFDSFEVDRSYFSFTLDLREGLDGVWKSKLRSKTRNQTRKGLKNNLTTRFGNLDLLEDFYRVISICWRDLGTPVHSKNFFRNILRQFGSRSRILVIYHDRIPVSSALLLSCGDTIHHPFATTLNRFKPLSVNNVLYWKIVEFAIENGISFFDMGRSHINQGTYRYKISWGGIPVQLYYNYVGIDHADIPAFDSAAIRIATRLWRFLPLSVSTGFGPFFIRRIL